ncbi:MAG: AbgT family transporter [Caldilineaceae bacterium]
MTVAQRYQKDAGLGTVVALMLPYSVAIALAWILLHRLAFLLGIPLGPGYLVGGGIPAEMGLCLHQSYTCRISVVVFMH